MPFDVDDVIVDGDCRTGSCEIWLVFDHGEFHSCHRVSRRGQLFCLYFAEMDRVDMFFITEDSFYRQK